MPLQTAVNPQTNETAVLVNGEWKTASQIAVNPTDQSKAYLVDGAWLTDTGTASLPVPKTTTQKVLGAVGNAVKTAVKADVGEAETAAALATGMLATPVAGVAGIAQGVKNKLGDWTGLWKPGMDADERVQQVQQGMTYQPRTDFGQKMTQGVGTGLSYVSSKPGEWVGSHGMDLATRWGASPELASAIGAAGNALTQVVPQMLLAKGAGVLKARAAAPKVAEVPPAATWGKGGAPGAAEPAAAATDAVGRAKAYVGGLGLDWSALSGEFRKKLEGIAQDATALGKLSPEAVKRQALLSQVGIDNPTKGQVTREPLQQRAEQLAKATGPGRVLRDLDVEHNAKLLEGVEKLRARVTAESLPTGSKARGDLPVGRSVQDTALRAKAQASENRYNNLYKKASETEPDATAPADPFYEMLDKNPAVQHLDWVSGFLKKGKVESKGMDAEGNETLVRRPLNIAELQDLRTRANRIIGSQAPDTHWAIDVKAAIDRVMDEAAPSAAPVWKEAIGAFKKHQQEFSDQTAVRNLVEEKPHTSDRRVAIEETARKTVTGRLEDLQKVKRSLLTGEDPAARGAGKIAWRDLKGWGLDYIRERMTKGVKNEAGDPHTTWVGLKRALDDIGDENLDELYGATARKQLRRYQEAAEILWTESSTRVKGSPTLDKILTFLDRLGGATSIAGGKLVTDPAAALAKGVSNVAKFGEERRAVADATRTPIDEQLSRTRRDVRRAQTYQAAEQLGAGVAPAVPAAESRSSQ